MTYNQNYRIIDINERMQTKDIAKKQLSVVSLSRETISIDISFYKL